MTKISFSSNGYALAGNFFQPKKSNPLAFLFIQGWTGHQNVKAAQQLADMGYASMTYDMRGHGESEGDLATFSRADFVSDAVTAYDYLEGAVGEGVSIGVIGSSFGSYCAVLLSAERAVRCLSLRVPASYPDEGFGEPQLPHVGSEALRAWRQKALHFSENRAFSRLHDFREEVQIIESEADEQVDHQVVQNYVNSVQDDQKLRYVVMKNAPHSLVNDELQNEYVSLLTHWVKSIA